MKRKMSSAERIIESVDEAIEAAKEDELKVILVLNSQTQCRKIAEQIRLRVGTAVTAVQGDLWIISFIGTPHASITMCPMYNPMAGAYSKEDETAHWSRFKGNEYHKGNPRAFLSPIGPYIRLPMP